MLWRWSLIRACSVPARIDESKTGKAERLQVLQEKMACALPAPFELAQTLPLLVQRFYS